MTSENTQLEPFTLDDINFILNALGKAKTNSEDFILVPEGFSLDEMASSLHGITDPVGQIQSWLQGTLNSIASWLESAVSTMLSPFVSGVQQFLNGIVSTLENIPQLFTPISQGFSTITNWITGFFSNLQSTLSNAFQSLGGTLEKFFKPVGEAFSKIENFIDSFVKKFGDLFKTAFSDLQSGIEKVTKPIADALSKLEKGIGDFFTKIGDTLKSVLSNIEKGLEKVLKPVEDAIGKLEKGIVSFFDHFGDTIKTVFGEIAEKISQVLRPITDAIGHLEHGIVTFFGNIGNALREIIGGVIDKITGVFGDFVNIFRTFGKDIGDFFSTFEKKIGGVFSTIADDIKKFFEPLVNAFKTIFKDVDTFFGNFGKVFKEVLGDITKGITDFFKPIVDFFSGIFDDIKKFFKNPFGEIKDFFGMIWNDLKKFFHPVVEFFEGVFDRIAKFFHPVVQFFEGIYDDLKRFFKNPIGEIKEFFGGVFDDLKKFFHPVVEFFVGIYDKLAQFFHPVVQFFDAVGTGVIDFFKNPAGTLKSWFSDIGKAIENFFKPVTNFFDSIYKEAEEIIKSPAWGELKKDIISFIHNPLKAIGNFIHQYIITPLEDFIKIIEPPLENAIKDIIRFIVGGIDAFFSDVMDIFEILAKGASSTLAKVSHDVYVGMEEVEKSFDWIFKEMAKMVSKAIKTGVHPIVTHATIGQDGLATGSVGTEVQGQQGSVGARYEPPINKYTIQFPSDVNDFITGLGYTGLFYGAIFGATIPLRWLAWTFRSFGKHVEDDVFLDALELAFFEGIGIEEAQEKVNAKFGIQRAIASQLANFADLLESFGSKVSQDLIFSVVLWGIQPLSRLISSSFRNFVPIEIPSLGEMSEAIRRYIPNANLSKQVSNMLYYMALMGYSDTVLDWYANFTKDEGLLAELRPSKLSGNSAYAEVLDRFNNTIKVPTSLIFELPTHSDIVNMKIRDIIQDPTSFQVLMAMRGIPANVSKLYLLLHYRYPPPTHIWRFFIRSLAGTLWFTPGSDAESEDVQELLKLYNLGNDYKPVAPADLNATSGKQYQANLKALSRYFGWEAYSPIPWEKNFAPDRWIMIDTLAEVPTKTDVRDMLRWGLFEQMADAMEKQGINLNTFTAKDLPKIQQQIIQGANTNTKIFYDLTLHSKLLQATGYNPYWIPAISVSSALEMELPERTLLRTGVLNLYRFGAIDSATTLSFMSGVFTSAMQVAYFDPSSGSWIPYTWYVPVQWLPGQRVLLTLRGIIDRETTLYMRLITQMNRIVENLVVDSADASKALKEYVQFANAITEEAIEEVSGTKVSLGVDKNFLALYETYAKVIRDENIKIAIRREGLRFLYRVLDFVMRGWLSIYDVQRIVNILKDNAYLTPEEAKFIDSLYPVVTGTLIPKDYPTPSQLAMLAEYMSVPQGLIQLAEEMRGIPSEYQPLWNDFITKFRPVKMYYQRYIERAINAYRFRAVDGKELETVLKDAPKYGFIDSQIKLFGKIAEIEATYESIVQSYPSAWFITVMGEYIDIPKEYIKNVFYYKRVNKDFEEVWSKYYASRQVKHFYDELIRRAINAYRFLAVDDTELNEILEEAKKLGYPASQIDVFETLASIEKELQIVLSNSPTLGELAFMGEYVNIPGDFIDFVLTHRRISKQYAEVWAKFYEGRRVKQYYQRFINIALQNYKWRVINTEKFNQYLSDATKFGFVQSQIDLLKAIADMEILYQEVLQNTPSLELLTVMGEYTDIPQSFIDTVLGTRRIGKNFAEVFNAYYRGRTAVEATNRFANVYIEVLRGFAVPEDVTKDLITVLKNYGWNATKITIFEKEVNLVNVYRQLEEMVPSIRQFAGDAVSIDNWEKYLTIILGVRGVDTKKYKDYLDFYKQLIRNRKVRGYIWFYIESLKLAYGYGLISDSLALQYLEWLKQFGVNDEAVQLLYYGLMFYRAYKFKVPITTPPSN